MIGGMSGVTADVVPYSTVMGNRAILSGLNIIGLKRREISKNEIAELRKVFKYIFYEKKQTLKYRINQTLKKEKKYKTIEKLLKFLLDNTKRSFCLPE